MTKSEQATTNLIHYMEVLDREFLIEGAEQKMSICHVLRHNTKNYIEDLRELNEYRKKYGKLEPKNGKVNSGIAEVTDTLHLSGHKSLSMRLISD